MVGEETIPQRLGMIKQQEINFLKKFVIPKKILKKLINLKR
jgi:hypothetical protein